MGQPLKTCDKIGATDILLKPGVAPMMRVDRWRFCDADRVEIEYLHALIDQHLRSRLKRDWGEFAEFQVNTERGSTFNVLAFGYPSTTMLLIARSPVDPPDLMVTMNDKDP